jgi:hypothetical protein
MGSLLDKRIPLPLALVVILSVALTGLWLVSMQSKPGRAMALGVAYQAAFATYAKEHGGRLPSSIRAGNFRRFVYHRGASEAEMEKRLKEFEAYYDLAWGTEASEVDANGFIASRQRFLFQPTANSPVSIENCRGMSQNLALRMMQIAATTSSPDE